MELHSTKDLPDNILTIPRGLFHILRDFQNICETAYNAQSLKQSKNSLSNTTSIYSDFFHQLLTKEE